MIRLMHKHARFLKMLSEAEAAVPTTGRIIMSKDGQGFCQLLLDNSSKKNAMSAQMMLDLASHVDDLTIDDNSVTGVSLTAKTGGGVFCSGLDLSLAKSTVNSSTKGRMMYEFMTDALNRIRNAPFVSVASIGGSCLGGGLELVTCTDYRIAIQRESDNDIPYFQSVHAKIGATPGWGGLSRSMKIMGRNDALSMFGTSARVPVEGAIDVGLVDFAIDYRGSDDAEEEFDDFCSMQGRNFLAPFLSQPYPDSIRAMKTIITADRDDTEEIEGEVFESRWFGPDMQSALNAVKK